jgi:hypothetical protein
MSDKASRVSKKRSISKSLRGSGMEVASENSERAPDKRENLSS